MVSIPDVSGIPDYDLTLLRGINRALTALEREDCAAAREILIRAQQDAEDEFLTAGKD